MLSKINIGLNELDAQCKEAFQYSVSDAYLGNLKMKLHIITVPWCKYLQPSAMDGK